METSLLLILLSAGLCTSTLPTHYKRTFIGTKLESVNWTVAQAHCRQNYTDLVTVHSQKEAQKLGEIVKNHSIDYMWIGLHRHIGSKKWSNGDNVTYENYTKDDQMEPNCYTMKENGGWGNVTCAENKTFMCYNKGYGNSTFGYTHIKQKKSWCDAQWYCREHHTDLVSIHDDSQNATVQKAGGSGDFWIGLMQADWEWSDGACSTFRNWSEFSPNANKDCGYIWTSGQIGNQECGHGIDGYICYEDQIYLIEEEKTWEGALTYCNQRYAGLLRIESLHDQRRVSRELTKARDRGVSQPVWLGLRQSRLFGFWIWPNGASVGWSNWEGGSQPEQPLSHICGAIATSEPFTWHDRDCKTKSYFLCEGEKK